MTPLNMAKHRNNPNMAFWKMIKVGYDHFELTRQEPKVSYCEKKYVFDAIRAPNAKNDPVFNVNAKCPAYAIDEQLADAMQQREAEETAEYNKLVSRGTPVAKLNTGIDGGMHQIFASHVPGGSTGLSEGGEGQGLTLLSLSRAPGTIPGTVNPPRAPWQAQQGVEPVVATAPPQAPAPQGQGTRVASAAPQQQQQSEGFFASLGRKIGIAGPDTTASAPPPPAPAKPKAEAKPLPKAFKPVEARQAAAPRPPLKPSVSDTAAAPAPAAAAPAAPARDAMVAGSQPIVGANSFDSRFSAAK